MVAHMSEDEDLERGADDEDTPESLLERLGRGTAEPWSAAGEAAMAGIYLSHITSLGYRPMPHDLGQEVISPVPRVVIEEVDALTRSRIYVRPDRIEAKLRDVYASDVALDPFIGVQRSPGSRELEALRAVLEAEAYNFSVQQAVNRNSEAVANAGELIRSHHQAAQAARVLRNSKLSSLVAANRQHGEKCLRELREGGAGSDPALTDAELQLLKNQYEIDLRDLDMRAGAIGLDDVLTQAESDIGQFASRAAEWVEGMSMGAMDHLRRERQARHKRRGIVFGSFAVLLALLGLVVDGAIPAGVASYVGVGAAVLLFVLDVVVERAMARRQRQSMLADLIREVRGAAKIVGDMVAHEGYVNGLLKSIGRPSVQLFPRSLLDPL
jgi:hypothetical protein